MSSDTSHISNGHKHIAYGLLLCIPIIPLAVTPLFPISIVLIPVCIYMVYKGYSIALHNKRIYAEHIANSHTHISTGYIRHGHHQPTHTTEDAPLPAPPTYPPVDLTEFESPDHTLTLDEPPF